METGTRFTSLAPTLAIRPTTPAQSGGKKDCHCSYNTRLPQDVLAGTGGHDHHDALRPKGDAFRWRACRWAWFPSSSTCDRRQPDLWQSAASCVSRLVQKPGNIAGAEQGIRNYNPNPLHIASTFAFTSALIAM